MVDLLSFPNDKLIICTSVDGGKTTNEMEITIGDEIINGKFTINELIHHLRLNFKDPNIEVRIILNNRSYSINMIGKKNGHCIFLHYPKSTS